MCDIKRTAGCTKWGVMVFQDALVIWVLISYSPGTMINAGGLVVHEKGKPFGGEGFSKRLESPKMPRVRLINSYKS